MPFHTSSVAAFAAFFCSRPSCLCSLSAAFFSHSAFSLAT
jgi:hypothetical protein